jgi:hypothetical protein
MSVDVAERRVPYLSLRKVSATRKATGRAINSASIGNILSPHRPNMNIAASATKPATKAAM